MPNQTDLYFFGKNNHEKIASGVLGNITNFGNDVFQTMTLLVKILAKISHLMFHELRLSQEPFYCNFFVGFSG